MSVTVNGVMALIFVGRRGSGGLTDARAQCGREFDAWPDQPAEGEATLDRHLGRVRSGEVGEVVRDDDTIVEGVPRQDPA
jgi:hypothetical protein|eukprot:COSAG01_NODE_92_length_27199_cov_100.594649_4_plen_80_part_00